MKEETKSSLAKIIAKEKKTERKVSQASSEAEKIINQAKAEKNELLTNASHLDDSKMNVILDKAREEIVIIQRDAKKQVAQETDKITQLPHNKIDQAVDLVIEKLIVKTV